MSNEITTPKSSSTVKSSIRFCNHTTLSESSSVKNNSVETNSEVDNTITTSENIAEDISPSQECLRSKNNSKSPEIKETTININEASTSPVSLRIMKQKLFKAMHPREKSCNGCRKDSEDDQSAKETVNNCSDCPPESLKAPPAPGSPLVNYIVQKLIKENGGIACNSCNESENIVNVVGCSSAAKEHTNGSCEATEVISGPTETTEMVETPAKANSVSEELKRNNIHSKIEALLLDVENTSGSESEIEENPFIETMTKTEDSDVEDTSGSESEIEENPFIETMAEEGEEDTPSEGSNDIIEVGEEINTTESEFSSDESYENNSFIDDDENCQLLSGEEYDLSFEKPKGRRRIIQLSSGSDDEIVKIPKKEKIVRKRKSRIIRLVDSSDEEPSKAEDLQLLQNEINSKSESCDNNENLEIEPQNTDDRRQFSDVEKNGNSIEAKSRENNDVCEDLEGEQENMNDKSEISDLEETSIHIKSDSDEENEDVEVASEKKDDMNQMCDLEENKNHVSEHYEKNVNLEVKPQNADNSSQNSDLEKNDSYIELESCNKSDENTKVELPTSNEEKKSQKIIILENIKISDVNIKNLSLHVNNLMNAKMKTTSEMDIHDGLEEVSVDNEAVKPAITTPVNNCRSAVTSECPQCVTGSGRKKRKRRDKEKKNTEASSDWTEELLPSESPKVASPNPFKNYFKFEMHNLNSYTGDSKKCKKRKRLHSNNSVCDDELVRKNKKKNKFGSKKEVAVGTHINILEEAILQDETQTGLFESSVIDEDWKVAKRKLKPSQISEKGSSNKEGKKAKERKFKSLSPNGSKFYTKDFRNLMLYNNATIKRMETKKFLRRKN